MPDSHVLGDADVISLRRAAAITHSVGSVNLTLRSGGTVIASVAPWVDAPVRTGWPILSACGFRNAVARAWCDQQSGQRVSLPGLGAGGLDIEWAVRPPGSVIGFGGVRAACAGQMVWALTSVLAPADLGAVLDEADDATGLAPPDPNSLDANMFRDERLGISVVHIETDSLATPHVAMLDEVLRRLIAATAAAELVASLAPV